MDNFEIEQQGAARDVIPSAAVKPAVAYRRRCFASAAVLGILTLAALSTMIRSTSPNSLRGGSSSSVDYSLPYNRTGAILESDEATKQIPHIIHFVVEACDSATHEKLRNDIVGANTTGFAIRCHGAPEREEYVRRHLPTYLDFYVNLPLPIMKADVFRMMVLHEEGGFYFDDDVDLYSSFRSNFEEMRQHRDIIVGWERRTEGADMGVWCEDYGGMLCNSLSVWSIAVVPKHPALKDVVDSCKDWFAQNTIKDLSRQAVLQHTGPAHFTGHILKFVPVEDVLGIEAFGCGQQHSHSPRCDPSSPSIWLKHRFEGKWVSQVGENPPVRSQLVGAINSTFKNSTFKNQTF